jgi:hypothetical protein
MNRDTQETRVAALLGHDIASLLLFPQPMSNPERWAWIAIGAATLEYITHGCGILVLPPSEIALGQPKLLIIFENFYSDRAERLSILSSISCCAFVSILTCDHGPS